jgi:AbiV family abortive infection protein
MPRDYDPSRILFERIFGHADQGYALDRISAGILAVLEHVEALLVEVQYLRTGGYRARAEFLLTTANEELGKAHLLLDAARLDATRHMSDLNALCVGFYNHLTKYAYMRAWQVWRQRGRATNNSFVIRGEFRQVGELFCADRVRMWRGSTDPEDGEPDMPHTTYFTRDAQLYVEFSDYSGQWIVPNPSQQFHDSGLWPKTDSYELAVGHLHAWQIIRDVDALSSDALALMNALWRRQRISRNTPATTLARLWTKTAATMADRSPITEGDIFVSPLCGWPCYQFLTDPAPAAH